MKSKSVSLAKAAAVLLFGCACALASAARLNLWLVPDTQNATIGQTVTVTVYANSTGPGTLALSDAYLAISWDPAILTNATPSFVSEPAPWVQSYWSPGNPINTNLQDGDAQRELLGQLPPDFPVAPAGIMRDPVNRIKVTSFQFTVHASAATTPVRLWGSLGTGSTNFYKGDYQIGQWDLTFENGAYSQANITQLPVDICPVSYTVTIGEDPDGGVSALCASDDVAVTFFNDSLSLEGEIVFDATAPVISSGNLRFSTETHVERGGLAERFFMYNWSTSSWSLFTGVTAPTTDTVIEISSTNLSQFIAGDGGIRAKIRWTPINDENPSQDGWLHSVDVAKWTISP